MQIWQENEGRVHYRLQFYLFLKINTEMEVRTQLVPARDCIPFPSLFEYLLASSYTPKHVSFSPCIWYLSAFPLSHFLSLTLFFLLFITLCSCSQFVGFQLRLEQGLPP